MTLPFRDTRVQPTHGVAEQEEEGNTIPHWSANEVEIDSIKYTPGDSSPFYTTTELGPDRDNVAKSIRDLCVTNVDHINAFTASPNHGLHPNLIDTHLCMLTHLRKEKAAIVRTAFSHTYNADRASILRASNYTYGDTNHADIVLIPILKQPIQYSSLHHRDVQP